MAKRKSSHKGPSSSKNTRLAEVRTDLAQMRTELAHERTFMAYIRTATTLLLFAMAFYGFSMLKGDWFWWTAVVSFVMGWGFVAVAVVRAYQHSKELRRLLRFFRRVPRKVPLIRRILRR